MVGNQVEMAVSRRVLAGKFVGKVGLDVVEWRR